MSESDSFIQEVTEEVRRDRFFHYWKKYGVYVIGVVALIVAGSAFWTWQRQQEVQAARDLGGRFIEAELSGGDPSAYAGIAAETEGAAAGLAELHAAAAMAAAGDRAGAAEAYARIAEAGDVPPIYRDLARLAAAQLGDGMEASARLVLLEPAIRPGGPFRLLALEARAAIRITSGDVEGGQADLRAILDDPLATEPTIARATELLLASGGTIE